MVGREGGRVPHYVAVIAASGLLLACASKQPASLTDTFIERGEPRLVMGDPQGADSLLDPSLQPPPLEELEVVRPPTVIPAADRVEDADPQLATALVVAEARPSAAAHRRVAELYQRHGIMDMAYDHLVVAERLAPKDAATQDHLARLWRAWGLEPVGLSAAYRAVNLAPDSPEAHNTLGTLLQATGHPDDAQQAYERGLELDPTAPYILNNLCYLALRDGDFDAALESCQAALAIDPTLAAASNNLALIYFSTGQDELAWQALQDAGPIWTAMYNLGLAHLARNNYSAAAAAFSAASKAKPSWAAPRLRAKQARAQSTTGPASR